MINIEVIKQFERFCELEPIWNDLLSKSDVDIPLMTFEWFYCWWKSYGKDKELYILLAKKNDEILGIAPLMRTKMKYRGLPIKAVKFISNEHTNRIGFILVSNKQQIVDSIFDFLLNHSPRFEMVIFDFVENDSDSYRCINHAVKKYFLKYRKIKSLTSPFIKIDCDWDTYLKSRSKSLRKKIRRIDNLVRRTGKEQVVSYSVDDIEKGLEEMMSVSRNSWKYKSNTAIASNANDIAFYRSLSVVTSSKGWFNLWIAKVNNNPIAFEYKITYKKKSYSLKVGYDETFKKLSPSFYLDSYSIKDSFLKRHDEYDLLGMSDSYKMSWASSIREHNCYWIFGNHGYAKLLGFIELKILAGIRKTGIVRRIYWRK